MYKDMEWFNFGTVGQFSALWDFFEKIFLNFFQGTRAYNYNGAE